MAVSQISIRFIVFVILCVMPLFVFAESNVSDKEIFSFLHKNVAESTSVLGSAIDACEKTKQNSKTIIIDPEKLNKIKTSNKEIILALTYLNYRNSFDCEKKARVQLAYDLGVLSKFKKSIKSDATDIIGINENLIFPSRKHIEITVQYLKTPEKLKAYLKDVIGHKPFNLIGTLKFNNLLKL